MSVARIEWGQILALENDIWHLDRLANVLTTLGTHDDIVDRECIYVLGCMLSQIGKRLEANYEAIKPIRDGARDDALHRRSRRPRRGLRRARPQAAPGVARAPRPAEGHGAGAALGPAVCGLRAVPGTSDSERRTPCESAVKELGPKTSQISGLSPDLRLEGLIPPTASAQTSGQRKSPAAVRLRPGLERGRASLLPAVEVPTHKATLRAVHAADWVPANVGDVGLSAGDSRGWRRAERGCRSRRGESGGAEHGQQSRGDHRCAQGTSPLVQPPEAVATSPASTPALQLLEGHTSQRAWRSTGVDRTECCTQSERSITFPCPSRTPFAHPVRAAPSSGVPQRFHEAAPILLVEMWVRTPYRKVTY